MPARTWPQHGRNARPLCERFSAGLQANNSSKPTPLRGVVVISSHSPLSASVTSTQRRGLTQALGRASETSVTRATQRGLLAMFRAATLALHSPQLTFGSFTAGPPDIHQAVPVTSLASFLGFPRFARRRTRQQALARVPAGEREIFTGSRPVLRVRATAGHGLTIRSSRHRFAASAKPRL